MNRRTVHFAGRVQGVGFRYTTESLAADFPEVRGYVRNLADGRVELVMEGADDQMDELVKAIQKRMDGLIHKTAAETSPATGEFKQFSIRH